MQQESNIYYPKPKPRKPIRISIKHLIKQTTNTNNHEKGKS